MNDLLTPTRPALRYFGGKWLLAPWIIEHLPPHRVYVEPFGGGASVLLRKPVSKFEVYNDLNSEVVHVFRVLRDVRMARRLKQLLANTPFAREEFLASYSPANDPVERARRYIVRSYQGHGSDSIRRRSGFRLSITNQNCHSRSFAQQHGAIEQFRTRLTHVVIENTDAFDLIRRLSRKRAKGLLFYVDPPYPMEGRSSCKERYDNEFTATQHEELAARCSTRCAQWPWSVATDARSTIAYTATGSGSNGTHSRTVAASAWNACGSIPRR